MFKKKKKEINIDGYLKFIDRVLKDDNVKKEVREQIKRFNKEGTLIIDGNNLTGKIMEKDANLYLDIKYEKNKFTCFYTNWSINSPVLIEQEELKEGNYKITKTEKSKLCLASNMNAYDTQIEEKIYNKEGDLLYEAESKSQEEFSSFNDKLIYIDDSPFKNNFTIEKTWYISNGSIIKYSIRKNELYTKEGINEFYSICEKPVERDIGMVYYFDELPKELFISFMTGKITIEEVLEKVKEKEQKKTLKNH